MLTIYRSNRAEWLASVLSEQLRLNPPELFETIEIVVNTWPTSRWLGEQLAVVNGINALIRFPFPGAYLRRLVQEVLELETEVEDPWQSSQLVWTLLDLLPELLTRYEADPIKEWLSKQELIEGQLNRDKWQLVESIADVFDDYALYRPEFIAEWKKSTSSSNKRKEALPSNMKWQPTLVELISQATKTDPFSLKVKKAIKKLRNGYKPSDQLPKELYIFGLSSLAPAQIELIQALSGVIDVKIFLLTPCPNLWHRCQSRREAIGTDWTDPLNGNWLVESTRLEATLGRMGAEFQQLLEGSGDSQLGEWREGNLFASPVAIAKEEGRESTLLEQIQQQLVSPSSQQSLSRLNDDNSLMFLACPGKLRQVQIIRDQIIQLLAKDESLEPRDILIMTPQIKELAPLISSVFSDIGATKVDLPWRITDRSQDDVPGLSQFMLSLLKLSNKRFTATELDKLLSNPCFQKQQGLDQEEVDNINSYLQLTGFRWGTDAEERGGDDIHSLSWCLDRWLLGLVIPNESGRATKGAAPFSKGLKTNDLTKWWGLLSLLIQQIKELRRPRKCGDWIKLLQSFLDDLFKDGGDWDWELKRFYSALEEWRQIAVECSLKIEADVVAEILTKTLSSESGRFGHRTGMLTISALEPMRAIPHRVIVLLGLDMNIFPRNIDMPSFHLLDQKRQLGDPQRSHQDRYAILEAIMSTRQHLLISWNCKDEISGEVIAPSSPIQQWLNQLKNDLSESDFIGLLREPPSNPLDRNNFITNKSIPPLSCDRRNLDARRCLDNLKTTKPIALAFPFAWNQKYIPNQQDISYELLQEWIAAPQLTWLKQLQLNPREWITQLRDLESLDLNELERYQLLQDQFKTFSESLIQLNQNELTNENEEWSKLYDGQGIFPKKSGAIIESKKLEARWTNLKAILIKFGPLRKSLLSLGNETKEIFFSGNRAVIVDIGLLKSKKIMEGWLTHLLLCTNGKYPSETIVIARNSSKGKKDQYQIELQWKPIDSQKAESILNDLKKLAIQGLDQCWLVPPESGWEFAKAQSKGITQSKKNFKQRWDGFLSFKGERAKEEMQLCFGMNYESENFFENEFFETSFNQLYDPILENLIRDINSK